MNTRRVILIVMDGCGVGAMPDAAAFGPYDAQSATLPHVFAAVPGLSLPTLERLGLGRTLGNGPHPPAPSARLRERGLGGEGLPNAEMGAWGRMAELSRGKDSVTGHWEMMGVVTETAFPTYPEGFPDDVIHAFEQSIGRETLGNVAASGTQILQQLGAEHVETGRPIVYTSADSVFQLAAHEDVVPVDVLYSWCETARALLTPPHNVQRVIARPFVGDAGHGFARTANRRDFPLSPPPGHLLDVLQSAGRTSHAIGVVAELFPAHCFTRRERTQTNADALQAILTAVEHGTDHFIFANCEDFDMLYGHRNDAAGFAQCLQEFDAALSPIVDALRPDDVLLLTADHGNDPTTPGTDHSREFVPLLVQNGPPSPPIMGGVGKPSPSLLPVIGPARRASAAGNRAGGASDLGTRATFADLAASIAAYLNVTWTGPGTPFL